MTRYGEAPASFTTVDSSKNISAGGNWIAGTSTIDCKHGTDDLLATHVAAQFEVNNATTSPTEGLDIEIGVQFSDDGTNWPDGGQNHPIYAHVDSDVGASLSASRVCEFAPLMRYARFEYKNNNSSDDVHVTSKAALFFTEDNS